jgi:(p)ppGpp synthase/HD superfamily hydrolase
MPQFSGFSDRVAHALAFAAKHGLSRTRPGRPVTHLAHPANIAIILARYDCDEVSLVAGVLGYLINDLEYTRQRELQQRVVEKFGSKVAEVVRQVTEPQYDSRGKRRGWKAWKMDFLADLALAEPRALEVCAATQIHSCGSVLTDLRRLGVEYLEQFSVAQADEMVWWYRACASTLEKHPAGPRPGMVAELLHLADRLATDLGQQGETAAG